MSQSKTKNSHQKRELKLRLSKGNNYIRCCFCKSLISTAKATIEHIKPLYLGGTWELDNLTLSCKTCNKDRGIADYIQYKLWRKGQLIKKPPTTISEKKRSVENENW